MTDSHFSTVSLQFQGEFQFNLELCFHHPREEMAIVQACAVECLVRVFLQGFVLAPAGFLTYWKGKKNEREKIFFDAPQEVYDYDVTFALEEVRSCVPFSSLLATAASVVVSFNEERLGGHSNCLFGSLASFE